MSSGNPYYDDQYPYDRLFKQWVSIGKMMLDGKRDVQIVSRILQRIIDGEESVLQLLDVVVRPVSDLNLSIRAKKVLDRLGIKRVGDLAQKKKEDLESVAQCGRITVYELEEQLTAHDLKLGMVLHPKIQELLRRIDSVDTTD